MMYFLLLFLFLPETALTGPACGGTFTAPRGVISTPNFPKKFPTPINCKWIIDAQSAPPNSSIIVYLTQVYVFEGLSFKEHKYYIPGFDLQGHEIYAVSEDTVNNVSFVRCHVEYLEITLNLSSLEGTHLRVLDDLLDVYGFNITYEITTRRNEREDKCTMRKCGFTGFCYDHFTHFSCDCFKGYSGEKCSEGAKSKCFADGNPICKNGGTCTHVGDSAVVCVCGPEFTGTHCEVPVADSSKEKGCADCLISCPFDGTLGNVCKCERSEGILSAVNDTVGFESTVIVHNSTLDMNSRADRERAKKYILGLLKSEYVNVDSVQISKSQLPNNDMTFRFQALKKDEKRIRAVINKWKHYGAIGNISLVEKEIFLTPVPSLFLKNVSISKNETIRINQDVILTCEARGSSRMYFRWFRNGFMVNASLDRSGNKWPKLIESDKGFYIAVLLIEKASSVDEGEYTCQVEDYGIQQCKSKFVKLRHHPEVWLEPTSLTIKKGKPFSIKCLSEDPRAKKFIYNWAKDGSLLRKNTDVEKYEILHPAGSLLQVTGLNKSATYTCVVHDESISSKMSIEVNVLDGAVSPCAPEEFEGILWPETASGKDFKHKCPRGFRNYASRSCIMLEDGSPKWLSPDYSNCSAFELTAPINNFKNLIAGFMQTTPLDILRNVSLYLDKNRTLLRGEGNVILDLVNEISDYNNFTRLSGMEEVTAIILEIIDEILSQINSLNKEQQVLRLQEILQKQLMFLVTATEYRMYRKPLKNILATIDEYHFAGMLQLLDSSIRLNKPSRIISVVYKNLDAFLTTKSIIRLTSDDRDIDYKVISNIVGMWISDADVAGAKFPFPFVHKPQPEASEWDFRCASAAFAGSNYAWDTNVCRGRRLNATTKLCECDRPGTMTLLLVKDLDVSPHVSSRPHDTIILIGCSTCLLISSFCAVVLLLNWIYHRSSFAFLKLQCCVSVSGTMVLFVVAFCQELPKNYFLYIVSFLQCFFFMGMSSQLSTLLIIYSELVEIQGKDSIQLTVVGIITGAPLLVVFGNYLAHLTMDIHLSYWWLLAGTLSFNVFAICTSVMSFLFLFLFFIILKMTQNDKPTAVRFLNKRSKQMKKTSLIFCSMIILAAISVVYVNILESEIWHYAFSITSVLMGLVVLSCLVLNSQLLMKKHFMEKLKMKQAQLGENAASPQKSDHGSDHFENAMDLHAAATASMKHSEFPTGIQRYSSTPATLTDPLSKSNSLNSPDILGSKVFVQLDLVASSLQTASRLPISPIDATKRSISYENNKIARAFDEPLKMAAEQLCVSDKDVMDSISHDLNYLLNGRVEFKEQHGTSQTLGI